MALPILVTASSTEATPPTLPTREGSLASRRVCCGTTSRKARAMGSLITIIAIGAVASIGMIADANVIERTVFLFTLLGSVCAGSALSVWMSHHHMFDAAGSRSVLANHLSP